MDDTRDPNDSTRSVWISLRKVSPRLALVSRSVCELERELGDTKLRGADILYCTAEDNALLRIRFDADQVSETFIAKLRAHAADFGASVIDVGRLAPGVRKRFAAAYQRAYTVRFPGVASSSEALEVLNRHLGALADDPKPPPANHARPAVFRVRFRRGDAWQLGRARSMTASSISIATGSPPRKGDTVQLEISVDDHPVVTPAIVLAVTPPETAAVMGAASFGARFLPTDEHIRVQLQRINVMLQNDPALIERPPRRRHVRYAVQWAVTVGLARDEVRTALDISESGVFIASEEVVPRGTPTGLVIPVEYDEPPIHAGARVSRVLEGPTAIARGTPSGYGLQITSMSEADTRRYAQLVDRVGHRAERHVYVGADTDRLPDLIEALAAVGYAASGTSDPAELLSRARTRDAPDLIILDRSLDRSDARLEHALVIAAHTHPANYLPFDGDPPHVWELADAALA